MSNLNGPSKKEWKLNKESEIRCEVGENSVLTLKLVSGLQFINSENIS